MLTANRRDFWQYGLDAVMREYADLWDAWRMVEAKAQPLSAISGALLAGVVAYTQVISVHVGVLEKVILSFICLSLLFSIACFLLAIRVVQVSSPHLGAGAAEEIRLLVNKSEPPETWGARYENLLADAIGLWVESCAQVSIELGKKQRLLNRGVDALLLSGVLIFFLAIYEILHGAAL